MENNHPLSTSSLEENIEIFLGEILSVETKRQVFEGRSKGETIGETARRLNLTDERIRQIEAKITRKFALSKEGRNIISQLSNIHTAEDLKSHCKKYYPQIIYLLRLYKDSFFYQCEPLNKFGL